MNHYVVSEMDNSFKVIRETKYSAPSKRWLYYHLCTVNNLNLTYPARIFLQNNNFLLIEKI